MLSCECGWWDDLVMWCYSDEMWRNLNEEDLCYFDENEYSLGLFEDIYIFKVWKRKLWISFGEGEDKISEFNFDGMFVFK